MFVQTLFIIAVFSRLTIAQQQPVYFEDGNGNQWELTWTSSTRWTKLNWTATGGSGGPNVGCGMTSGPEGFLYGSPDRHLISGGEDDGRYPSSPPTSISLQGAGCFLTNFVDSVGEHVFWAPSCSVDEAYMDNSQNFFVYQSFALQGQSSCAATNSQMTSFEDGLQDEYVFFFDTSNHIHVMFWQWGLPYLSQGWKDTDVSAATSSSGSRVASGITSFRNGNGLHVYYFGANNHLYELYQGTQGWSNDDLTANHGGILVGNGSGVTSFNNGNGEHVYYIGTNQHVYEMYWNGGSHLWSNGDITAATGNTLAAVGSALTSFSNSNGEHVYYLGTNSHVYELYWNSSTGSWSNGDITSATGAPAAGNLSALTSFTQ